MHPHQLASRTSILLNDKRHSTDIRLPPQYTALRHLRDTRAAVSETAHVSWVHIPMPDWLRVTVLEIFIPCSLVRSDQGSTKLSKDSTKEAPRSTFPHMRRQPVSRIHSHFPEGVRDHARRVSAYLLDLRSPHSHMYKVATLAR